MIYLDKNKQEIKDNDGVLFTHEDPVEITGYSRYVTSVKLCFWSENEKRYIPFSEIDEESVIAEGEVINLRTEKQKIDW